MPAADIELYNAWGAQQSPPLTWHSCASKCVHGLRLCMFVELERPKVGHLALCNGRDRNQAPCQRYDGD